MDDGITLDQFRLWNVKGLPSKRKNTDDGSEELAASSYAKRHLFA